MLVNCAHFLNYLLLSLRFCSLYYAAEVYGNKSNIVYSLSKLKNKSCGFPATNLEDRETLAGSGDGSRTAIIIYTSGSTGTPKGNKTSNKLRVTFQTHFDISRTST